MGPGMKIETFDGLTLLGRRWWFRVVDVQNGQTLAASESYNSAEARNSTATRLSRALVAPIVKGKRR